MPGLFPDVFGDVSCKPDPHPDRFSVKHAEAGFHEIIAKPATLSRVFKKMVRNYTLGQFDSIYLTDNQDMTGGVDGTYC
jgi:hypothetical protein